MRSLSTTILALSMPYCLLANIGPQGFYAHLNKYFVETGSFQGHGMQKALNAGFPEIHSIEINYIHAQNCKNLFANRPQMHVWVGDSGKMLFDVIKSLDAPITFWLDGHKGWEEVGEGKNTPLIEELEQIKRHPIKTHTILIDDMHCCNTLLFDYLSQEDIIKKVLEINPNYTITFEPGGDEGEYPVNVLVARVE